MRSDVGLAVALFVLGSLACGSKQSAAPPAQAPTEERALHVVSATVLTNGCDNLGKADAKLAESAMTKLVDGCTEVSGGKFIFTATLLPGGRIEIAPGKDQPPVVPICVLKNELRHKMAIKSPCTLDVELDEKSVALPDAGAR